MAQRFEAVEENDSTQAVVVTQMMENIKALSERMTKLHDVVVGYEAVPGPGVGAPPSRLPPEVQDTSSPGSATTPAPPPRRPASSGGDPLSESSLPEELLEGL